LGIPLKLFGTAKLKGLYGKYTVIHKTKTKTKTSGILEDPKIL